MEGKHRPHHLDGVSRRRKIRRTDVAGGMEHRHLRRLGLGRGRGRQRPRRASCARRGAARGGARDSVGGQRHQSGGEHVIFDFGRNMSGQFEITVSGKAGAAVTMMPGEFLSGGKVNVGRSGTSTYTLKGGGPETWRLSFSTIGMRYLQVGGVYADRHATPRADHHGCESVRDVHGIEQRRHVHGLGRPLQQDPRPGSADAAEQHHQHSHRRSELREARLAGGRLDHAALICISAGRAKLVHQDHARRSRKPANERSVSRHRAQLFLHEQLGFPRHI